MTCCALPSAFAWYMAVLAIVVGHIFAVYIAHKIAFRTIRDRAKALSSQFPMLLLMIGYTMISLWIIAQPITLEPGTNPAAFVIH